MLALAIEFTGGTRVTRAFGKDSDSRQAPCGRRGRNRRFGGHSGGETPGPIPNPEVKPSSADGTALETGWESRSPPDIVKEGPPFAGALLHLQGKVRLCQGRERNPVAEGGPARPVLMGPRRSRCRDGWSRRYGRPLARARATG